MSRENSSFRGKVAIFLCLLLEYAWLLVGRKLFLYAYGRYGVKNVEPHIREIVDSGRDMHYYTPHISFLAKKILDIGCGDAWKTIHYAKFSGKVVGVDINKMWIKRGYQKIKNDITILAADACRLPFKSAEFDIVISNDAVEHIKETSEAISEMKRTVSKDGFICINFGPTWKSPFGAHLGFSEFLSFPWMHLVFSIHSIKAMLIKLGKHREREYRQFADLSRLTITKFQNILAQHNLRKLHFKLVTFPPFGFTLKTPLREYFATQVILILKK
jgi:ubiquinone/menaquinone biosynthesis C-methylase UbiE